MAKSITTIPATRDLFSSKPLQAASVRKVAGYARVSTDKDEQFSSYEAQVDYYTNYIKNHDGWSFVKVYTDEGVSGTHTARREGFNAMIRDAVNGKIDLILTKSVSRFARNTVDSLTKIRELKDHGVEVYFEKENIWTFDSKGEVLLTIMSSLAQEESRSISENVRWGWRKRFEDGKVSLAYSTFLGYDKGEDGNLVVNPEQAEIVKRIFSMFLEGYGTNAIALQLTREKVMKPTGNSRWTTGSIERILSNEKYTGNAILQKTYKADLLAKRRQNNGELKKYFVSDSHEAIISQDQFNIVQEELKKKKTERSNSVVSKYCFSGKVFCGECGQMYGSKLWHSTDKYRSVVWRCNGKYENEITCSTPRLKEDDLKEAFLSALNKLSMNKTKVIKTLKTITNEVLKTTEAEKALSRLETEIKEISILLNQGIGGAPVTDAERYDELYNRLIECNTKAENLRSEICDKDTRKRAITSFFSELNKLESFYSEFEETVFRGLCEKITVFSGYRIVVTFKSGYEIEVSI